MTDFFSIIVAHDKKRGIGKDNKIPFRFKEDMFNFKRLTQNNVVIMGRLTFESINKIPLPNRVNIVVSRIEEPFNSHDLVYCNSFEDALNYSFSNFPEKEVYVIGGEQIYNIAIKNSKCKDLIITIVDNEYNCDKFFPEYAKQWKLKEVMIKSEAFVVNVYIRRE